MELPSYVLDEASVVRSCGEPVNKVGDSSSWTEFLSMVVGSIENWKAFKFRIPKSTSEIQTSHQCRPANQNVARMEDIRSELRWLTGGVIYLTIVLI